MLPQCVRFHGQIREFILYIQATVTEELYTKKQSLNVLGELFIHRNDRYELAGHWFLKRSHFFGFSHVSFFKIFQFENSLPLNQTHFAHHRLNLFLQGQFVNTQLVFFDVEAGQSAKDSADFFKEEGEVGAKRLNDGADKDGDSQEKGVDFGEEDEVEDDGKGTDIDNFETVVEKIFGVGTSDPVFFLDGENVDHDIFEVDQLRACFFGGSFEGSERVTENRNEIQGEGDLCGEADEAEEEVEEGGNHLEGFRLLKNSRVIGQIHCPIQTEKMELICDRDNCLHEEALVDDQRSREGHSKGNVEKNLDKLDDLSFS